MTPRASDLLDHLQDAHAVSMIRTVRGSIGKHLTALLDAAPGAPIVIEASTTAECLEQLHSRLDGREHRAVMTTLPDSGEGGLDP